MGDWGIGWEMGSREWDIVVADNSGERAITNW